MYIMCILSPCGMENVSRMNIIFAWEEKLTKSILKEEKLTK